MFRPRGVYMSDWKSLDRYMILSSDAHAGALSVDYRDYLPSQWHTEFDSWLAAVVNPWGDTNDTRNWRSTDRLPSIESEGVTGEVLSPNTLPPFCDILAILSGVPRDGSDLSRRFAGFQAHNR